MNRKNKPKNKPQKTNPNPAQETEKDVEPEITEKVEERVPEIVCDTTQVEGMCDNDSPKKPRRNRGKKKKEEVSDAPVESEVKGECLELKDDDEKEIQPASRKKKGKKPGTEVPVKDEESDKKEDIPANKPQEVISDDIKSDADKKKKNKKQKKRNDSEKSGKNEETLSCTAAFQKLMQPKTEDVKVVKKDEDSKPKEVLPPELDDTIPKEDVNLEQPFEMAKNKKKHKKEAKDVSSTKDEKPSEMLSKVGTDPVIKPEDHKKAVEDIKKIDDVVKTATVSSQFDMKETSLEMKRANTETTEVVDTSVSLSTILTEDASKNKKKHKKESKAQDADKPKPDDSEKEIEFEDLFEQMVPITSEFVEENNTKMEDIKVEQKNIENIIHELNPPEKAEAIMDTKKEMQQDMQIKLDDIEKEDMAKSKKKNKKDKKHPRQETAAPKMTEETKETSSEPANIKEKIGEKEQTKNVKSEEIPKPVVEKDIFDVLQTKLEIIEESDTIAKPTEQTTVPLQEVKSDILLQKEEIFEAKGEETHEDIEHKDKNLKPKAKIAKPVDKKNKGKHQSDKQEALVKEKSPEVSITDAANMQQEPTEEIKQPIIETTVESIDTKNISESVKDNTSIDEPGNVIKAAIIEPKEVKSIIIEEKEKKSSIETESNITDLTKPDNKEHHDKDHSKKSKKHAQPKKMEKDSKDTTAQTSAGNVGKATETPKPIIEPDDEVACIAKGTFAVIMPDEIEHPRSASEQLDTNNNTLIEEITSVNLDVPFTMPDTPFITGQVESPILTVRSVVSDVVVTEIDETEKTDLKSKVMEVNKDMEELRLSIERSLAELTAMETDEAEQEKKAETINVDSKAQKEGGNVEIDIKSKETIEVTPADTPKEKDKEPPKEDRITTEDQPIIPTRKDNKGKNKSKKKGKQESGQQTTQQTSTTTTPESKEKTDDDNKDKEQDKKENTKKKDGQHDDDFEPIENFEDALTSSVEDVDKSFDVISKEMQKQADEGDENSDEVKADEKNVTKVTPPKNLLGHPVIPARSSKTDYKKEKNKPPNERLARVKIKDGNTIEKESKESQTEGKAKYAEVTCVTNENEEYIYKYSFRKVFLVNTCNVCKCELKSNRLACSFCNLLFYCNKKHRDDDWPAHQSFCFAISTIAHLKGEKHIYGDAKGVTGHNYRLLRMQTIVSCEKILKRKLQPWEQEVLLYPRICADVNCREFRQGLLVDCSGCGQISYCSSNADHLPKTHARWCNSYSLYHKLVMYQLANGRLEPRLPTKMLNQDRITHNINRLLADMYDEKIDMNDIQYAALTQLATAPLTTVYSYQLYRTKMEAMTNGMAKKPSFTIHVVGAELQFEADTLHKWETFFLHLKPDVVELNVVLIGPELNPSSLPLELLGKIKLCANCRVDKRRLNFHFQDKKLYSDYFGSDDFLPPDIVCAFNPSLQRSSSYNTNQWKSTLTCIFKSKVPFLVTSYTMSEMQRDFNLIQLHFKDEFNLVSEAKFNPFASVRPDRNFISDDDMPLLFKNYCFMILIGVF